VGRGWVVGRGCGWVEASRNSIALHAISACLYIKSGCPSVRLHDTL